MRIAIFSDFHIGFAKGTRRESEAFDQAKEAFELALKEKADLILLAGDLFNEAVPSQEAWLQMFQLFSLLREYKQGREKVTYSKAGAKKEFSFSHTPVISIAGTHEFRSKDFGNALEVLQEAGCLVYLHAAKAEFEKAGETVVVQGLSGVPEKKALDALRMWAPKPVQGARNILLLHQSIKEFLPTDDEMAASIALADLPNGFDLVVDGHLHWASDKNFEDKKFIVTGSTVATQMKNLESKKPKGVFFFETKQNELKFVPLPKQRKLFYEKLELKDASPEQAMEAVEKRLEELLQGLDGIPLVKFKLKGTLAKGVTSSDLDFNPVKKRFGEKALVFIDLGFEEQGFKQKLESLREKQLGSKSVAAMGFDLLEKNLAETGFKDGFDVKRVFDLLAENDVDRVVEILSRAKK